MHWSRAENNLHRFIHRYSVFVFGCSTVFGYRRWMTSINWVGATILSKYIKYKVYTMLSTRIPVWNFSFLFFFCCCCCCCFLLSSNHFHLDDETNGCSMFDNWKLNHLISNAVRAFSLTLNLFISIYQWKAMRFDFGIFVLPFLFTNASEYSASMTC